MNNPILYQAGGGLAVLFFLVLIYFFTKSWRWLHVTLMPFVFAAAITFCVYASMVYRTHNAWRSRARDNEAAYTQQYTDHQRLLYGDLTELVQSEKPLRTQNGIFARFIKDRGRVWRGCTPQAPQAGGVTTVATGADGAPPNRIDQNTILYAFREEPPPPELGLLPDARVPVMYLGEFSATAVTDLSVTLTPTIPLDEFQTRVMALGDATWVLYESMPVDGYTYFTQPSDVPPDLNANADENPVFGQVDEVDLERIFKKTEEPFGPAGEDHLEMLKAYQRNGKRGNEETDPPENLWQKVRFIEDYKEGTVDSDAELGGVQASPFFFDRGRAEVPLLRRGGEATLKKDSVAVFPTDEAQRLLQQNYVEIVEPIYVRSLNHYDYLYRNIYQRSVRLDEEAVRLQAMILDNQESNRRIVDQITFRTQERDNLQVDLEKFTYELDQIKAYHAKLAQKLNDTNAELSRLYRSNYLLAAELTRMQDQLTDEINKRTAEAVSTTQ